MKKTILQVTEEPSEDALNRLQDLFSVRFQDLNLLKLALRHPSASIKENKNTINNQRLEFLGDAILKLAISQILYEKFPLDDEGRLSQIRAFVVSDELLAQVSENLGLGQFIIMSSDEEKNGGRTRLTILADGLEAIFGAYYLDKNNFSDVYLLIKKLFVPYIEQTALQEVIEYKTALQEYCQKRKIDLPEYVLVSANGPDHQKIFFVECFLSNKGKLFRAEAFAPNRKIAEKLAAKKLLELINVPKKN